MNPTESNSCKPVLKQYWPVDKESMREVHRLPSVSREGLAGAGTPVAHYASTVTFQLH